MEVSEKVPLEGEELEEFWRREREKEEASRSLGEEMGEGGQGEAPLGEASSSGLTVQSGQVQRNHCS